MKISALAATALVSLVANNNIADTRTTVNAFTATISTKKSNHILISNSIKYDDRASLSVLNGANNNLDQETTTTSTSINENMNIPVIPFTPGTAYEFDNLLNDGVFAWMVPYTKMFGFVEGNSFNNILPGAEVDQNLSDEEKKSREEKATKDISNIGIEERERRGKIGKVFYFYALLYAIVSAIFLDNGETLSIIGHILPKFAVVVPLSFGRGLTLSEDTGLWNLAQAGLQDINGSIEPIKDRNVARELLNKVNALNIATIRDCTIISLLWAILPTSRSQPIAYDAALFAALYYVRDKIPKDV